tara:strand:+ start:718 stop:819 length:102 start_codon:yes stop_codon:yes gene_type:complete
MTKAMADNKLKTALLFTVHDGGAAHVSADYACP